MDEIETYPENRRIYNCLKKSAMHVCATPLEWDKQSIENFSKLIKDIQDGIIHFKRIRGEATACAEGISEAHVGASVLLGRNESSTEAQPRNPREQYAENILKDNEGNYFVIDCDIDYLIPAFGGSVKFDNSLSEISA